MVSVIQDLCLCLVVSWVSSCLSSFHPSDTAAESLALLSSQVVRLLQLELCGSQLGGTPVPQLGCRKVWAGVWAQGACTCHFISHSEIPLIFIFISLSLLYQSPISSFLTLDPTLLSRYSTDFGALSP